MLWGPFHGRPMQIINILNSSHCSVCSWKHRCPTTICWMGCSAMVEGKSTESHSEHWRATLLDPHTTGELYSHCMSPWERHCFKDGSYDHYQNTTVVAPWPAVIAPKFLRPLVRPGSSPWQAWSSPLLMYLPRKDGRLSWPWQTWPPNHSTEVPNPLPACMACMCVPPSWLVATPWLVPILLRPLMKVQGLSPRRGSSPYSLYQPQRDGRLSTPWPVECRFMNH